MQEQAIMDYNSISQRNYISSLEHKLRELGNGESFIDFLIENVSLDELVHQKQFEKLYYTIALVEYLNGDIAKKHNYISKYTTGKMDRLTFAKGVEMYCETVKNTELKERELKNAIPEFLKYNLVVTKVGNAV